MEIWSRERAEFCRAYLETRSIADAEKRSGYQLHEPALKCVYLLCDPRDGSIFYVGKGSPARIFQHEEEFRRGDTHNPHKNARIQEILEAGLTVVRRIFADHLTPGEATWLESRLIEELGPTGLTNVLPAEKRQILGVAARRWKRKSLLARIVG